MNRVFSILALASSILLAACGDGRIENVQAEAENQSQRLESRANEISAEAENGTSAAEQTLENQAAALLNQSEETGAGGNQANSSR
jgi:hypothetical protein